MKKMWQEIFANSPTVRLELLGEVPVYLGMAIQILTSMILGGLIGMDREKKQKAAGIKTNMLICMGAALYTAVSLLNQKIGTSGSYDPNRVLAQVVSGIGFLGAGAILRDKGNIVGLTTAALIWVVAAVGVTIGSGFPIIATLFTLSFLVVLKLLGPINRFFNIEFAHSFEILSKGSIHHVAMQKLRASEYNISSLKEIVIDDIRDHHQLTFTLVMHPKKAERFIAEIEVHPKVLQASLIRKKVLDKSPEQALHKD
jgi:putative Mg2+ transporter-C (MgtC) family protein